jgi:hypothetical protein
MTLEDFLATISQSAPPSGLSPALQALWYAEKGDWDRAHQIAQEDHSRDGSWVHANLHREEGDLWNARYWYDRAARPESRASVADERRAIIESLL